MIKTAALGDVLRTTSLLPGLAERYPGLELTWVTAHGARALVENHPLVSRVETVDPADPGEVEALTRRLAGTRWERVISLDDEEPLCRLASALDAAQLSGAHLDDQGARAYTSDVAPWFDMGLLSVHGKQAADALKVANERSHPEIFASMLGVRVGRPELALPAQAVEQAQAFADAHDLKGKGPVIGLNTGAGGRWRTKELPVARTIEVARSLAQHERGHVTFLTLGGLAEEERNAALVAGLRAVEPALRVVDGGTQNSLEVFAGRVSLCDLLLVSDSLALHVAVARGVPVVTYFAPTSAAEIELYGRGEKVVSSSPDYCSYRTDADNSSITPERVSAAVLRVLAAERAASRE